MVVKNSSAASYQHSNVVFPPTVHQLEEDSSVLSRSTNRTKIGSFLLRGSDPTIRPNIGLTNSYEYSLFGLAIHELMQYQRRYDLCLCTISFVFIFFTTLIKRFLHPAKLILSFYLLCFIFVILISDCITMILMYYNKNNYNQNNTYYQFFKQVQEIILNYIGIVQYPFPGRSFYFMLCSTMCIAINGSIEFLLGIAYLSSSVTTIYCWFNYPEYKKPYLEMQQEFFQKHYPPNDTNNQRQGATWSVFSPLSSSNGRSRQQDESVSLLSSSSLYQNV